MTTAQAFGAKLKLARKRKLISQQEAAELCKISIKEFGNIERGKSKPSMDTAIWIYRMFGVSIYELNADLPDKE